jgi:hypothetical protein
VGKHAGLGHVDGEMSTDPEPEALALLAAEEILRRIYGDDLQGCPVSLETVARIIGHALEQKVRQSSELVGLYEKVVEAVHLLSTPPDSEKVKGSEALQALLSERLDAIRMVASKTIETTGCLRAPRGETD